MSKECRDTNGNDGLTGHKSGVHNNTSITSHYSYTILDGAIHNAITLFPLMYS